MNFSLRQCVRGTTLLALCASQTALLAQTGTASEDATAQSSPPTPPPAVEKNPTKLRCWTGDVLAAEASKVIVEIKNLEKYDMPPNLQTASVETETTDAVAVGGGGDPSRYVNAVVAMKLDPGRSIGVYDYVLTDGNKDFRCYAISEEDVPYDYDKWEFSDPDSRNIHKLLFVVELPAFDTGKLKYSLRYNLFEDKTKELPLVFKNLGEEAFTSCEDIPPEGIVGVGVEEETAKVPEAGEDVGSLIDALK